MTGMRFEGRSFDVLADARQATSRLLDAVPREDRLGHAVGIPAAQAEDPALLYVPAAWRSRCPAGRDPLDCSWAMVLTARSPAGGCPWSGTPGRRGRR
jgi:hypothetical protein